jgi:type I restriction enzyme S subunit
METPLVVPPFEERWAILDHIRQMSAKNSSTIDLAERQVELLQERRTALISAAVTGKIDVRGWQPPPAAAAGATP